MKKKNLLSLALAVTMMFGSAAALPEGAFDEFASVSVSAEKATKKSGNYEYKILDDGTVEITKYVGMGGVVNIPPTLDEMAVTSIGKLSFYYEYEYESITSVTIPKGVTSIDSEAFRNCTKIKNVTIPSSVTIIGNCAFMDCSSLKSVIMENGVTNIGESAFNGCKSLTSVTIPNSTVNIGYGAFYDCQSLNDVRIPKSVSTIGNRAFGYTENKIEDFIIYCYEGSQAEIYAKDNNFEYKYYCKVKFFLISKQHKYAPKLVSSGLLLYYPI